MKLPFGDERVAKPSWAYFFGRYDQSVLDRILETLSNHGSAEQFSGRRLLQMIGQLAPTTGDSAIRADLGQTFTFASERLLATPVFHAPAVVQDDIRIALDQAAPVLTAATTPDAALTADDAERAGMATFGGGNQLTAVALTTLFADASANFVVLYGDDLQGGLVMNTLNKTLLEGGPGNWPELGAGPNDMLALSGDFSAGFALPTDPAGLDLVSLGAGSDYNLTAADGNVAAGETLTIDAMPLGSGGRVIFDGSAEGDGSFVFFGGALGDTFLGGDGDDRIVGNGGGDTLRGNGGSDIFAYTAARESSGAGYDTLADFTPGVDHIDLGGTVAGFAAPIASGTLSTASFDADLGAAVAGLGASRAVWFAPDAGDLAGTIFLVVDGNGVAGYQPGEDYVFAVAGSPLADLTSHTDIFI